MPGAEKRNETQVASSPRPFRHGAALGVLLAAFVTVGAWYSVVIPAGEGVDETAHLDYVLYVKSTRGLPVQPRSRQASVQVWMGHHPPLYYVLGALLVSWADTSDRAVAVQANPHFVWDETGARGWNAMLHFGQDEFPWRGTVLALHVLRWLGVALGAIALGAVYCTARLLIPEHAWAPLAASAIVAANPSFVYMSSTVHHDVLLTALYGWGIWWAVRAVRAPVSTGNLIVGGVLAGAAALTKLSGLTLIGVMGVALFLRAWRAQDWRSVLKPASIVFGVGAGLAGWWYIRNQILYGDPLGWQMFLSVHRHMVRSGPYTWNVFVNEFLAQLGRTFWGAFGFMHIVLPESVRRIMWSATGIAAAGLVVAMLRKRRWPARWAEWVVGLVAFGLIVASFVRFSISTVGAGHGRYLFPAAPIMGALLIVGINGWLNWRLEPVIAGLVAGGMLWYAVWTPVTFALPKYAPPETASPEQIPEAQPVDAVFGGALKLVACHLSSDVALPDSNLEVTTIWQATGPAESRPDAFVVLSLTDEAGQVLAQNKFYPVVSLTPAVWKPTAQYVARESLHVPASVTAGRAQIMVTVLDKRGGSPLPVDGRAGPSVELASLLAVGQLSAVKQDQVPNARRQVLGDSIGLAGYELPTASVTPGGLLLVNLYWRVLKPPPADYTVFVHVVNAQGQLVAQFDRPPGGGTLPTSSWQMGDIWRDVYPVPLPSDMAPGTYAVRVGMYTWPSLERLAATQDGQNIGDYVALGSLTVR